LTWYIYLAVDLFLTAIGECGNISACFYQTLLYLTMFAVKREPQPYCNLLLPFIGLFIKGLKLFVVLVVFHRRWLSTDHETSHTHRMLLRDNKRQWQLCQLSMSDCVSCAAVVWFSMLLLR